MRRTLQVIAALVIALALTNAASARADSAGSQQTRKVYKGELALRHLDLSPEQKAQVKAIHQQAKADAQKATKEQKQQIRKAANEKIRTQVLTDAQRQQLDEMNQSHHKQHKQAHKAAHHA